MAQLSHPCKTTGKTIALTRCNSVSKVMSLLFNMLKDLDIHKPETRFSKNTVTESLGKNYKFNILL